MSLLPFASRRTGTQEAAAGADGRATPLALGLRPTTPLAWWLDPARATVLIVLPIFCAAAYLNRFNYSDFGASENFVTPFTFGLAMLSMGLLVLGITIGRSLQPRQDVITLIDQTRAETVLVTIGWFTLVAYALLLGTLATHLSLVLELLRGNVSAGSDLREVLGRIPGVTSFIQFGVVYLALLSALVTIAEYRPPTRIWVMTAAVITVTFLRALLASERLAMLEALAAILVVPVAFRWRPSPWRGLAPVLGVVLVFLAFSAGEYFRSWQYYQSFYSSYFDFITQRFFGYFSTSINNGAGTFMLYAQYGTKPEITSAWVTHFPVLGALISPPGQLSTLDNFLSTYASPEFNNPGGFYAAYLDYPFAIASLFMVAIGVAIGAAYRSFQNKALLGLMLYPVIFLGQTDLIRLIYIADVRTLPILIGALLVRYWLKPIEVPRDRALMNMAATRRRQDKGAVAIASA